ncbi:MobA/MobL family protein [Pelagibacterium mangrovi]|uniref:MobA/MobL family protein n=1 Tax=Pelagibacterium mangrovi TaxID=3119828 RepID=UPI002FC85F0A
MTIGFARMHLLGRSAGQSAVERYRYIARAGAYAARTDLARGPITIAPLGTPDRLRDLTLWREVEDRAPRKDSILGAELVLALPVFSILPLKDAEQLVTCFCDAMIASNGLGATYAIHAAHDPDAAAAETDRVESADGPAVAEVIDTVSSWPHVHILITPKTLGPNGLDAKRCTDLEPLVRGVGRNRTVICATPWRQIWTRFLDHALAMAGAETRVRLQAPNTGRHIGPARALALLQGDIERGEAPNGQRWPRVNAEIEARNTRTLEQAPVLQEAVFTRAGVADLLSRYLDLKGVALASRSQQFLDSIDAVPLRDPVTGTPTPLFSTQARLEQARRIDDHARTLTASRSEPVLAADTVGKLVIRLGRDSEFVPPITDLLAHGHRLVVVETGEFGSILPALNEIIEHAGCQPIHIGHQSMTLAPLGRRKARFVIPVQMRKKVEAGSIVILDRPDQLSLEHLETLFEIATREDCRILMVRRPHSLPFARNAVIDRIAARAKLHALASSLLPIRPSWEAPVDRELRALTDILGRGHARSFADAAARLAFARRAQGHDQPTTLVGSSAEIDSAVTDVGGKGRSNDQVQPDAITLLLPHWGRQAPLYGGRERRRTPLLIDRTATPTLAHLLVQAALGAGDERIFFSATAFGYADASGETHGQVSAVADLVALYRHHLDHLFAAKLPEEGLARENALADLLRADISSVIEELGPCSDRSTAPGSQPIDTYGSTGFPGDDDPFSVEMSDGDAGYDDDPAPDTAFEQNFESDPAEDDDDRPADDFDVGADPEGW